MTFNNSRFGKLENIETNSVPLPVFNSSFGGQTDHARRSSDWLNPNLSESKKLRRNKAISGIIPDIEITNWSENEVDLIKEEREVGRDVMSQQSPPRPSRLDLMQRSDISVETLSTPEISGLRTSTWSRSPTRTFVRNFP